jgi:hypothetical protein
MFSQIFMSKIRDLERELIEPIEKTSSSSKEEIWYTMRIDKNRQSNL